MKGGHIVAVELLEGLSDDEACEKAFAIVEKERANGVEAFEVWDRARMVLQHPPADEEPMPLIQSN